MIHKPLMITGLLAIALLPSCRKNGAGGADSGPQDSQQKQETPEAVRFGANVKAIVTKSVGALDVWNAQPLHIYGLERTEEGLDLTDIFIDNAPATAPVTSSPAESAMSQEIKVYFNSETQEPYYYGIDNMYDFFGYYVDDACGETPTPEIGNGTLSLPFVIDGTQDLMLAATDKELDILAASLINGGTEVNKNRLYSAYSARRQVRPTLRFQHQLSRFRFVVQSGNRESDSADPIRLTQLLMESETRGTLIIASNNGQQQGIVNPGTPAFLPLRLGADMHELDEENITLSKGENAPHPLDGSILAIPGRESYRLRLVFTQAGYSSEFALEPEIDFSQLVRPDGLDAISAARPGEQYTVTLIVYGMEKVQVNVTLEEWVDGGQFSFDQDQED